MIFNYRNSISKQQLLKADDVLIEAEKQVVFRECNATFVFRRMPQRIILLINDWNYNHLSPQTYEALHMFEMNFNNRFGISTSSDFNLSGEKNDR